MKTYTPEEKKRAEELSNKWAKEKLSMHVCREQDISMVEEILTNQQHDLL